MQQLFAPGTPWGMAWMDRVLPRIVALVEPHAERTIFSRFVPAKEPGQGHGTWKRYYERWAEMTLDRIGAEAVNLVPELAAFVPPAKTIDKHVYSPWVETGLHARLRANNIDTLVISGGETEVCVLATVLGAVDHGYRVVLATDALCSSADATHDAMLQIYHSRYGMQVEAVTTQVILDEWRV
jgi:nicotinamidase-related amidase